MSTGLFVVTKAPLLDLADCVSNSLQVNLAFTTTQPQQRGKR